MDTHSEIVKVLSRATDDGANRTADYADALMPLVRRAQAEAWDKAFEVVTDAAPDDVWFAAWNSLDNPYEKEGAGA